ncbi:hypothetical protein EVAR_46907_1 [Eumeta japonica]|uniref:Uncharacterized protein n=1 Tax=Eumeta variegata TaxID=151549 RepID=A0A4C1Y1Y8_EUMVA|nr:hypothetical protein EVAR_46907_1 [Eumeta japonica]
MYIDCLFINLNLGLSFDYDPVTVSDRHLGHVKNSNSGLIDSNMGLVFYSDFATGHSFNLGKSCCQIKLFLDYITLRRYYLSVYISSSYRVEASAIAPVASLVRFRSHHRS